MKYKKIIVDRIAYHRRGEERRGEMRRGEMRRGEMRRGEKRRREERLGFGEAMIVERREEKNRMGDKERKRKQGEMIEDGEYTARERARERERVVVCGVGGVGFKGKVCAVSHRPCYYI